MHTEVQKTRGSLKTKRGKGWLSGGGKMLQRRLRLACSKVPGGGQLNQVFYLCIFLSTGEMPSAPMRRKGS
jgi:hypothetical protein